MDLVKQKQQQLDDLTKPQLSGTIVQVAAASNGDHQENSLVTLSIHLKNQGAPTAIENISVSIIHDSKTFKTQLLPPFNLTLAQSQGGPPINIPVAANILFKAQRQAIPTNVPVDTWLQVTASGITKDEVVSKGTKISLTFTDVATNSKHEIVQYMSGDDIKLIDPDKLSRQTR